MDQRIIGFLPWWDGEEEEMEREEEEMERENMRMRLAAYRHIEAQAQQLARGVDGVMRTGSSTATSGSVQLPQQPVSLVYPHRLQASSCVREEGQRSKCQRSRRQLGMPQHANQNDSEVLNSASSPIQRMPWEVAHQPKVSAPALRPTVTPSTKKSTHQLPLPMQPEPSERKFSLPPMPSPGVRSEQNFQNRQNRISRPPGFPLPLPRMTAERKANARVSTAQRSGVHLRQQPVTSAMVGKESPAPGKTWIDAVPFQPIKTAEQRANASNGTAQVSGVNVQKQLVTSAMVANDRSHFCKTWTDASVQFPPTPETEQLIGKAMSPILPPVSWDPKQKMENAFTAEPIGKGFNDEKVIQTQQGQLEFTEQQLDALQAFERLKRTIGTLPPESVRQASVSLLEMEEHLMRLIQAASPDGTVGNNNVKKHDPSIDLGEKVTPPIITCIEEEILRKEEVGDALSKAEAMEEEEQTLKKEKVSDESAATHVVDAQSEAEATPAVISIHQEKQLQTIEESFHKCNPEAGSVPEEVSCVDGDDENHEMQEWVLVTL